MLYFSVHRYEKALFFPSSPDAAADAVGTGSGKGTTVNVGWNTNGFKRPGDGEYRAVWEEILLPIGRAYEPDLVIVAAGFDAAEGDPLGGCHVTTDGFAELTRGLMTLANGNLIT